MKRTGKHNVHHDTIRPIRRKQRNRLSVDSKSDTRETCTDCYNFYNLLGLHSGTKEARICRKYLSNYFNGDFYISSTDKLTDGQFLQLLKRKKTRNSKLDRQRRAEIRASYKVSQLLDMLKRPLKRRHKTINDYPKVLDVGSEDKYWPKALKQAGFKEVYGINVPGFFNDPAIFSSKAYTKFKLFNGTMLPAEYPYDFNIVTITMVLHHIKPSKRLSLIKSIRRHMNNTGYVMVYEHAINLDHAILLNNCIHKLYEYVNSNEPFKDGSDYWYMTDTDVTELFKKAGFSIVEYRSVVRSDKMFMLFTPS